MPGEARASVLPMRHFGGGSSLACYEDGHSHNPRHPATPKGAATSVRALEQCLTLWTMAYETRAANAGGAGE